ncbi:MAG: DinB family protein [Candidatus Promineifilaceae bacterium]
MIDYSSVQNNEMKIADLAKQVSKDELRDSSNESIDRMLALLENAVDADITFDPSDEGASDPYAAEGEEGIGWSLGHLIAHVTAGSEEGATFSSVLARGHALEERPRYETPWRDITTVAQCVQRLEESRRMRNAYLDTWPDTPHLDVIRAGMSGQFAEWTGPLNAIGCFLLGLGHELIHFDQIAEVMRQSAAARSA